MVLAFLGKLEAFVNVVIDRLVELGLIRLTQDVAQDAELGKPELAAGMRLVICRKRLNAAGVELEHVKNGRACTAQADECDGPMQVGILYGQL